MIRLRRALERQHDQRRKREVWRTFDPIDRNGGFGALEAIDESRLAPRAGAPGRARGETEIVTYVREGAVAYEDSTGHAGVIDAGEFHCGVLARGSRHSQANVSRIAWAHVFQIQMCRSAPALEPRPEQKRFSAADRRGGLCIVASPDARSGSLRLGQDTRIYAALLAPGQHVVHELAPARGVWLHVVQGEVALDDLVLVTGDGAGVTTGRAVSVTARDGSEILLLDVACGA
jgi:quercetin 2,3-dioxygenase